MTTSTIRQVRDMASLVQLVEEKTLLQCIETLCAGVCLSFGARHQTSHKCKLYACVAETIKRAIMLRLLDTYASKIAKICLLACDSANKPSFQNL